MSNALAAFIRTLKLFSRRWLPAGLIVALVAVLPWAAQAARVTMPLNGTWLIDDSVELDAMPVEFAHRVPVPGLAHLANPLSNSQLSITDSRLSIWKPRSSIIRKSCFAP
jgi:hypothetical protein